MEEGDGRVRGDVTTQEWSERNAKFLPLKIEIGDKS